MAKEGENEVVSDLIGFLNASPTAFHAVGLDWRSEFAVSDTMDSSVEIKKKKKKKKEKKIYDNEVCRDGELVDIGDKVEKGEGEKKNKSKSKEKKKKKKKLEITDENDVSGDVEMDDIGDKPDGVNNFVGVSKKKKKHKEKINSSDDEVSGYVLSDDIVKANKNYRDEKTSKSKRKEKKKKKKKVEIDGVSGYAKLCAIGDKFDSVEDFVEDRKEKKKKKKKKKKMNTSDDEVSGCVESDDIVGAYKDGGKSGNEKSIESESEGRKKKKKKKGEKEKTDYAHEGSLDVGDEIDLAGIKRKRKKYECGVVEEDSRVEKRRKAKTVKDGMEENFYKGNKRGKEADEMDNVSENPKPKQKSKRVTFSTHVEVFPSSIGFEMEKQKEGLEQHSTGLTSEIEEQKEGMEQHSAGLTSEMEKQKEGLEQHLYFTKKDDQILKHFTKKEDEILKKAVEKYVKDHNLGENLADGIKIVLDGRKNGRLYGVWKEIGATLPHRASSSLRKRARILHERGNNESIWRSDTEEQVGRERVYRRSFSEEEDAIIKEAVEKYVKEHDLGKNLADGINMIFNVRENPQLRGCWKEIAAALPSWPYESMQCRAYWLYMRKNNENATERWKNEMENLEGELVQGKRYSKEEDEMIKEAVEKFVKEHQLGESLADGINMVLHIKENPQLRGCWKEIGAALPYRPWVSIYKRAHNLYERDDKREWTTEEYELIRRYHEEHGSDWKTLADALGKHRVHLKDVWRRIKLRNEKRGYWSQDEYQKLFDLVNKDLQMKVHEERKSMHGMLRDNIGWGAISEKLGTRCQPMCCAKWYNQLSSSMVAEGEWEDVDDYHLIEALYSLDATCQEDVDWDSLLEHRSGDVSRKRWNQMARHIGEHRSKSFAEQVDILSKRYCPELLEVREAMDSRPVVP
ncbi:hypothetical protein RJ641_014244 [Dillenia turbinata]|uniref:RNA polymerase I termination factor n=1 Tax=Dillenia turbinata TaxID=194707 RepID=A0AAN8Z128_9MAGN